MAFDVVLAIGMGSINPALKDRAGLGVSGGGLLRILTQEIVVAL